VTGGGAAAEGGAASLFSEGLCIFLTVTHSIIGVALSVKGVRGGGAGAGVRGSGQVP